MPIKTGVACRKAKCRLRARSCDIMAAAVAYMRKERPVSDMLSDIKPLIAGNWKMNGLVGSLSEVEALAAALASEPCAAEVLICPPFTLIDRLAHRLAGSAIQLGGQDCHANPSGAHTGDTSAAMLQDLGTTYVIVGHSERRTDHRETNAMVAAKAQAAQQAGLIPIICIGETLAEREAGQVMSVVLGQLRDSTAGLANPSYVIAYEPVWAIGTGKTPTVADVAEVHLAIRDTLMAIDAAAGATVRILYGGSVKPGNAVELLSVPHVNGALVGGASLKSADFLPIIRAARP
jgi:triosephosphate isomerase (TIM)